MRRAVASRVGLALILIAHLGASWVSPKGALAEDRGQRVRPGPTPVATAAAGLLGSVGILGDVVRLGAKSDGLVLMHGWRCNVLHVRVLRVDDSAPSRLVGTEIAAHFPPYGQPTYEGPAHTLRGDVAKVGQRLLLYVEPHVFPEDDKADPTFAWLVDTEACGWSSWSPDAEKRFFQCVVQRKKKGRHSSRTTKTRDRDGRDSE